MIWGEIEEEQYHALRADEELELSQQNSDPVSSKVHLSLFELHKARSEFSKAVRVGQSDGRGHPIHRSDKES